LMFYAASPPTNTISGFAAGDEIVLKAVSYISGATASVASAGVVTISNGGQLFNLHIAGAAVGEKGFSFGPGGILTLSADPVAAQGFVRQTMAITAPKPDSLVAAFTDASGHGLAPTARANGYRHGIAMTYDQTPPAAAEHAAHLAKFF